MNPGDIVTVANDGLTVDSETLGGLYAARGFTQRALKDLVEASSRGRFFDDCTIVAIRRLP